MSFMDLIFCLIHLESLGYYKLMEGIFSIYLRPSMTANTPQDADLKIGMVDDVMTILNVEGMYYLIYFQTKRR